MAQIGSFEAFLDEWLVRQEQILNELILAQDKFKEPHQECVLENLIFRVLAHYQDYFDEKSRFCEINVFHVFSPTWFTQLEKSFFWIAGFKPGFALTLVTKSIQDLSENQVNRLKKLKSDTKVEEKSLADELAKIHEGMAGPTLLGLARKLGAQLVLTRPGDDDEEGEDIEVDENMEMLRCFMTNLVIDADRLRTRTVQKVVGILNPLQSVKFFIAIAQLQLKVRMMGKQKESDETNQQNESSNEATIA